MSALEIFAAVTSLAAVYLASKRKVLTWPVGIAGSTAYLFVFYAAGLLSDAVLQIGFTLMQAYGWVQWKTNSGMNAGEIRVRKITLRESAILLAVLAPCFFVWGGLMSTYTTAQLPWLDAGCAFLSLGAQWMQTRRLLENWWVWIAADLIYVGIYIQRELYVTAGLYAIFLLLAVMGAAEWKRKLNQEAKASII